MVTKKNKKDTKEVIVSTPKDYYYKPKKNTEAANGIVRRKESFLKALGLEYGALSKACKRANICMSTYRNYYNEDLEFKQAVDDIRFAVIDDVSDSLVKSALGVQSDGSIDHTKADPLRQMFFLKTQAGWSETTKTEITHKKEVIKIIPAGNFDEAEIIGDGDKSE